MNSFTSGILNWQKKTMKIPRKGGPLDIYTSYFMSTNIYLEVQDTIFLKFLKFRKKMRKVFQ
jgi:hypothetical protein